MGKIIIVVVVIIIIIIITTTTTTSIIICREYCKNKDRKCLKLITLMLLGHSIKGFIILSNSFHSSQVIFKSRGLARLVLIFPLVLSPGSYWKWLRWNEMELFVMSIVNTNDFLWKLLTQESFHTYRWSMIVLLLTVTDVSTTSAVVICRVKVSCITSVTTARVVQTSVTVNNSPIQDYVHPDDHAYSTYFLVISCYDLGHENW